MPFDDLGPVGWQFVVPGIEEVLEHPEQVEIQEARAIAQQERAIRQHFLERQQAVSELGLHGFLQGMPLVNAAAPKLALFVADERQLVFPRHKLAEVNVVQFERHTFNVVLDVAPEQGLFALEFCGEQTELELLVEVFTDDLGIFVGLEDHAAAIADDRHAVVAFLGKLPDQGAVVGLFEIVDFESNAGKAQDVPLH